MEEKKHEHREQFENWLSAHAKSHKSSVITTREYNVIKEYLLNGNQRQSESKVDRNVKRRVERNNFKLVDLVGLGFDAVVCKAPSAGTENEEDDTVPVGSFKRVAKQDEIFDIIWKAHCEEGEHAGYLKTYKKVCDNHAQISKPIVREFCRLGSTCSLKTVQNVRAPLKPIITCGFMERIQIDLISEQTAPDGDYNYIGHFMDHFTKFHVLFPLKEKSAPEVADNLIRLVFSYFGLPYILHSDNGTEFRNKVIDSTIEKWPGEAKSVRGAPRHSQSQGLVEQGNFSCELMVASRRQDTGTNNWSSWLPQIQYALNTQVSESTKMTTFEIVYGQKPNCLSDLCKGSKKDILEEEDVKSLLQSRNITSLQDIKHTQNKPEENISGPNSEQCIVSDCKKTLVVGKVENDEEAKGTVGAGDYNCTSTSSTEKHGQDCLTNESSQCDDEKNDNSNTSLLFNTTDIQTLNTILHQNQGAIVYIESVLETNSGDLQEKDIIKDLTNTYKQVDSSSPSSSENMHGRVNINDSITYRQVDSPSSPVSSVSSVSESVVTKLVDINLDDFRHFLKQTCSINKVKQFLSSKEKIKTITRIDQMPIEGDDDYEKFKYEMELSDIYDEEIEEVENYVFRLFPKLTNLSTYGSKVRVFAIQTVQEYLDRTEQLDTEGFQDQDQKVTQCKEPVFKVSCPKRKAIREKVQKRALENAEKMIDKYAKKKRIRLMNFKVGQSVSVKIPKADRSSSDVRRLPCEVISVKGGTQQLYELACVHGTLDRLVSASDIMPYPSRVKVEKSKLKTKISIRTAASKSSVITKSVFSCHCKKGCKNATCQCRKADMLCTSRCHKGLSCSNNRPNDVNNRDRKENVDPLRNAGVDFDLPSFEATVVEDNSAVVLRNTCCIDNWLVIFRIMSMENPAVIKVLHDSYSNAYPKIFNIISMIGKQSYLQAKAQIRELNNLATVNSVVNFLGNEKDYFIRHMQFLFAHNISSSCQSRFCPEPISSFVSNNYLHMVNVSSSSVSISHTINSWLYDGCRSLCRRKFSPNHNLPPPEYIYWDTGLEEKESSSSLAAVPLPYCNGLRTSECRKFARGLPLILPVGVDVVCRAKKLSWDNIPKTVNLVNDKEKRYKLVAVTFWSGKEDVGHYSVLVQIRDEWKYYDGWKLGNKLHSSMPPPNFTASTCLYVLD